jgi:hypothetical protein
MADFDKKVGGHNEGQEGWLGVSPIEKDKAGKEEFSKDFTKKEDGFFGSFIIFMKKILNIFKRKSDEFLMSREQLIEDLLSFKKMLQILAHEDQSHNPEFTLQLSELWHNLMDVLDQSGLKKSDHPFRELYLFIEKIHAFPQGEDHSLGFYLTEYVGKEWLPFPFMDMLHQLYQQNQENPQRSYLSEWIAQLDAIAASFDENSE